MLKNGNNWPCSFKEKVKNIQFFTDDARRQSKCHLSDLGDLKTEWIRESVNGY